MPTPELNSVWFQSTRLRIGATTEVSYRHSVGRTVRCPLAPRPKAPMQWIAPREKTTATRRWRTACGRPQTSSRPLIDEVVGMKQVSAQSAKERHI
jgi:hypothetical protein